jgi:hypothetical protein
MVFKMYGTEQYSGLAKGLPIPEGGGEIAIGQGNVF